MPGKSEVRCMNPNPLNIRRPEAGAGQQADLQNPMLMRGHHPGDQPLAPGLEDSSEWRTNWKSAQNWH